MRGLTDDEAMYLIECTEPTAGDVEEYGLALTFDDSAYRSPAGVSVRSRGLTERQTFVTSDGLWDVSFDVINWRGKLALACWTASKVLAALVSR